MHEMMRNPSYKECLEKTHEPKKLEVSSFTSFIVAKTLAFYSFTPPKATPAMIYLDNRA